MPLQFPRKLFEILEKESDEIIRWLPEGTAFKIIDQNRFQNEIIPKYFRHNQIASVQRQLNLYGFRTVNRGTNKGVIFHPKFRRGDWESIDSIERNPQPSSSSTSSHQNKQHSAIPSEKKNPRSRSQSINLSVPQYDGKSESEEQQFQTEQVSCTIHSDGTDSHQENDSTNEYITEAIAFLSSSAGGASSLAAIPAIPSTEYQPSLPIIHEVVPTPSAETNSNVIEKDSSIPVVEPSPVMPSLQLPNNPNYVNIVDPGINHMITFIPGRYVETKEIGTNTDISLLWNCLPIHKSNC